MSTERTRRLVPQLLRERTFRHYWTGQTISLFGDQVSILALPLTAILVLHAGAAQTGYLTAAGLAPSLLFSIAAGSWVDRVGHRRRVMLIADVVRAALLASIPVAYVLGVLSFAQLYGIAFAVGCASVFFSVAQSTVFASIVAPPQYVDANSLIHGSRALSFVCGQSAGGILVQLLTAPGAIAFDAVSYLGSALFLSRIHPAEPATAAGGRGHITEGARFIWRSPTVRALLAATATINVFNFATSAIVILYATRALGVGPAQLGLVLGAGAVGAVLGAAITSRISRRLGVGRTFTLSCVLFPAPLILLPVAAGMSKPVILALLFAAEFGAGSGW
jgi:MFS family permease